MNVKARPHRLIDTFTYDLNCSLAASLCGADEQRFGE